jgi:hypothetical protein
MRPTPRKWPQTELCANQTEPTFLRFSTDFETIAEFSKLHPITHATSSMWRHSIADLIIFRHACTQINSLLNYGLSDLISCCHETRLPRVDAPISTVLQPPMLNFFQNFISCWRRPSTVDHWLRFARRRHLHNANHYLHAIEGSAFPTCIDRCN